MPLAILYGGSDQAHGHKNLGCNGTSIDMMQVVNLTTQCPALYHV